MYQPEFGFECQCVLKNTMLACIETVIPWHDRTGQSSSTYSICTTVSACRADMAISPCARAALCPACAGRNFGVKMIEKTERKPCRPHLERHRHQLPTESAAASPLTRSAGGSIGWVRDRDIAVAMLRWIMAFAAAAKDQLRHTHVRRAQPSLLLLRARAQMCTCKKGDCTY